MTAINLIKSFRKSHFTPPPKKKQKTPQNPTKNKQNPISMYMYVCFYVSCSSLWSKTQVILSISIMYRYLFVIQGPVKLFMQERCFDAETSCISTLKWRPLTRRQMLVFFQRLSVTFPDIEIALNGPYPSVCRNCN